MSETLIEKIKRLLGLNKDKPEPQAAKSEGSGSPEETQACPNCGDPNCQGC